jgi:GT2 family glycosyltransferase
VGPTANRGSLSGKASSSVIAVSGIVVSYDKRDLLVECLRSVGEALGSLEDPSEVVVVDNGSSDGSVELVRDRFPDVSVVALGENRGFAAGVNAGLASATGEWILLINNDATIAPDGVAELLRVGRLAPDIGGVAAQMRFADRPDTINSAGVAVDRLAVVYDRLLGRPAAESETEPIEVFGVCCGGALLRREMLDELGGLDGSLFFALDDGDLAWRARMRGWRFLYAPAAVIHHRHGGTMPHGSSAKYFHVGRNRVRIIAKNATTRHLLRYGIPMLLYDLGYVVFVALRDRDLAPLRGRLRGLREWSRYRHAGDASRRPVDLERVRGIRAALSRRRAWNGK